MAYDMANISVRNLDEQTIMALRVQASHHGVSMEEEVRQIIKRSVSTSEKIGDMAVKYFGSVLGVDLELPIRKRHDPLDLDE